jgi:hypothetical protein
MTSTSRLLSALLASSVVGAAHAAGPTASVRLDVRAPAECTSQADLTTRILGRLRRDSFGDDDATLEVRARFAALPSGNVVAELTLTGPGTKPSSRRLVARSCAQAADAAALIIAVTLDPTSLSRAATTIEEAKARGESSSNPSPESSSVAKSDGATPRPSRPAPAAFEPGELASPGWAGSPRFGAQLAAQVFGGMAPSLLPGVAVHAIAGLDRDGLWSPALMLGAAHGFDATVSARGGTADFWVDTVSVDACALRIQFRALETRACASALVGRLSANGTDTGNSAGVVRRPFAATGAAAIFALRIHSLIELTARAAGGVNLIRDSFEFAPVVFHSVPSMNFAASVGFGVRSR